MTQSPARQLPVSLSVPPTGQGRGAGQGADFEPLRRRVNRPSGRHTLYEAQLAGQTGTRRGLRGGPPVLRAARTAYLKTQWAGEDDRRLPSGLLTVVSV